MEFARIAGAKIIAVDINEQRLASCREKQNVQDTINPLKENITGKLTEITNGDMATVIIDATGNQKAINNSFHLMAHGGRYILVGLQNSDVIFSHPEFHRREGTLMSSRNATRQDFEYVINCISEGLLHPENYITHRVSFDEANKHFESWLNGQTEVIKAMISAG